MQFVITVPLLDVFLNRRSVSNCMMVCVRINTRLAQQGELTINMYSYDFQKCQINDLFLNTVKGH